MRAFLFLSFILIFQGLSAQTKNPFDIARKGSSSEMEILYQSDPETVNAIDGNGNSVLILACYHGNVPVASFLAPRVKDINYITAQGNALMAAVMSNKPEIIKLLAKQKANLNLQDASGKTALLLAAFYNKVSIVKELINAGADKTLKDIDGKNALDYARLNQNTELIILLDKN